jgi:DNA adenine methylase
MFNRYHSAGFFPNGDPDIFIDMFAGSGCVGSWVKANYPNTTIVLNEACSELIHMYQHMKKNNYQYFEKEYESHIKNGYAAFSTVEDRKKYYYDLRNKYAKDHHLMNPVEQAAALYYMLQTGFNGIWQTSKNFNFRYASPAGLMTWKHPGKLFDLQKTRKWAEFIDTCVLMSGDFEATAAFFGKGNWFYADPPYRLSYAKYNSAGVFSDHDQVRLCKFLHDAHSSGCLVATSNREILPNNWQPTRGTIKYGWFSDKFNDDFNCKYHQVKYTVGRHNHGIGANSTEVLIKNY